MTGLDLAKDRLLEVRLFGGPPAPPATRADQALLMLIPFLAPDAAALKIACVVTNGNLEAVDEGVSFVIKTDKEVLDKMGEWCVDMHGKVRRSLGGSPPACPADAPPPTTLPTHWATDGSHASVPRLAPLARICRAAGARLHQDADPKPDDGRPRRQHSPRRPGLSQARAGPGDELDCRLAPLRPSPKTSQPSPARDADTSSGPAS